MSLKVLCIFVAIAVVVLASPRDYHPVPTKTAFLEDPNEIYRYKRSPEEDDKKEDPEFKFKVKVEDSKQDGRSLYGETKYKAWESENGRHKVETYADGYVREGGDKYKFQPNNQRDSNYRVGGTYEYKCC